MVRSHASLHCKRASAVQLPALALPARRAVCLIVGTRCNSLVYHDTDCSRIAYCRHSHSPVYGRDPCGNAVMTLLQRTCRTYFPDSMQPQRVPYCACINVLSGFCIQTGSSLLVGRRLQLTSGVNVEPPACALRLNGSVAQRHGSNHLCHVATQMPEEMH